MSPPIVSESSKAASSGEGSKSTSDEEQNKGEIPSGHPPAKRQRLSGENQLDNAAVVESLLRMSDQKGSQ